jgi:hypothetical protein
MTSSKLQELARLGAEARLRSLEEERQGILGTFPELRAGSASAGRVRNAVADRLPAATAPRKRMSLAMRKAVGDRMRAYWASRRAERQNGSQAPSAQSQRRRAIRRS